MKKRVEKHSFLGTREIIYFEEDKEGEYAYINGEWIWIKTGR